MERTKDHYCWVKVERVEGERQAATDEADAAALAAPARERVAATVQDPKAETRLSEMRAELAAGEAASQAAPGPGALSGRRGPPAAPGPAFQGIGFQPTSGPRPPPRVYGGSVLAGWWGIDEEFDGVRGSGTRVSMLPLTGTRAEAIAWLDSGEGRAWVAGSVTYFLQCFTVTGNF